MSDTTNEASQYPRTYGEASGSAHNIVEARKRYEELAQRELSARSVARLRASGEFDPDRLGHQELAKNGPLTIGEHLEMLATGEVMARYYSHPITVHRAAEAGSNSRRTRPRGAPRQSTSARNTWPG